MTAAKLSEYGRSFQIKAIYALLTNKKFLQKIADILNVDYFDSPSHKWIVEKILAYFSKYNTYPTMEVLKIELKKLKSKDELLSVAVKKDLKEAYTSLHEDSEYVEEEFDMFCRNQKLKDALLKSVDLLEKGEFDSIWRLVGDAVKASFDKNVGHEYDKDVETRYRDEIKAMDFPWPILNTITDGGLNEDSLMLVLAPPGIGKSTICCNLAVHTAKKEKNVVYYTLELSENYVGKKIDSILIGEEVKKLKHRRKEVELAIQGLGGRILIKEYSPRKASLDTIQTHLEYLKNNMDFQTDLIIIDYPELLRPKRKREKITEESEDIFTELKGMCKEMKIPIVAPSQVNRTGARDAIIEGDKIAGNYGKIMIGDFVIALARPRKLKQKNKAVATIIKSRLGPDASSFMVDTDLSKGYINITEKEYDEMEDHNDDLLEDSNVKKSIKKKLDLISQ